MTSGRPTVSFVVTVYNKAPWLPQVLDAIAAQRGDFARQCVFVDDGSTDDSLAILRARTATWPDTVIITQTNAGPSNASNAGLARATGDYVKFVDGDDVLAPDATAHLLAVLRRHAADLAFGAGGHYERGATPAPTPAADSEGEALPDALGLVLTSPPCNLTQVLVRRAACAAVGGFDARIFVQDYPFLLRLAEKHRFARSPATVCYFPRQSGGRLTDDHANMLFHANLTVWLFCREHDLARDRLRLAASRCIGRAWLYAKRHRQAGPFSPAYRAFLMDRLFPSGNRDVALARMRATLDAFGAEPQRRYRDLLSGR
ncbi:MAG: glycosyltransferase [Alphaproteobacteria bacterium]|nr:glycosyltransferase [Alphaproteobacteria bacterium]